MHRAAAAVTALVLTLATTATARAQSVPPLEADPVQGDIDRVVRQSGAALRACRARLNRAERSALARVLRVRLPIGVGNDVRDLQLDPAATSLRRYRTCLLPVARTWQLGRPETHVPVVLVVTGADLRRLLSGR